VYQGTYLLTAFTNSVFHLTEAHTRTSDITPQTTSAGIDRTEHPRKLDKPTKTVVTHNSPRGRQQQVNNNGVVTRRHLVNALFLLACVFRKLLVSSLRILGATVSSTFIVTKRSAIVNLYVLIEVLDIWRCFVCGCYNVLSLIAVALLVEVLTPLARLTAFLPSTWQTALYPDPDGCGTATAPKDQAPSEQS
jgi:hypothetical protein